jgi:hypothetical protein
VRIYGTFGHTFDRGSQEVALNCEPDENFDRVFAEYGEILRKTKVDNFMMEEVDDEGKTRKIF